ncbi:MAG TPA: BON domain-containing protein [Buttiauxella sp.]|uniref:BON domain-containing protein n=1 Tax=Buttiauxella sp. TaxID=1972222 RepID=UPI002B474809|nr:BON domain-containing protein [Buttiauxella sp.]HKM96646.1 BON domain-containing protein [Buttiauxella sp.]
MTKVKSLTAVCGAILAAVMLVGCVGSATEESTGNYIDDSAVTARVKSALLTEKSLKSSAISVETFKGRVQLSGFLSSTAEVNKAVSVTKAVKGVKTVANDLIVK